MQALVDLLPLVAFAVAYWLTRDMQTAILVIMVAISLQVVIIWLVKRTVSRMLLASAVLVVVLGGISLLLNNDLIFKWKPTVLNWLFAAIFLGSRYIGDRTVAQRILESVATGRVSPHAGGLAEAEPDVGRLLPGVRRSKHHRRLSVSRGRLGELQAVRPDRHDAGVRPAPGAVAQQPRRRKKSNALRHLGNGCTRQPGWPRWLRAPRTWHGLPRCGTRADW